MSGHAWLHPGRHHAERAASQVGAADERRRRLTLVAASMCIFTVQLDFFALQLALPRMADDLDTTSTNLQWVVSGYMLALAAFLIPGGRLGDILGRRRMLLVGVAIFGLASLGAGLAWSADVVIGFRLVLGVGAAIVFPLAIAVVTDAYPPERTMRAIGNAYGIGAVSMALGPIVGGVLTELIDWRAVFLVFVPLTAATAAVIWVGVRESRDTTVPRSIDLPALLAIVLGIAAVTFAVDRANVWSAAGTLGLAAAGMALLAAFVLRERVARWPLVGLDLFRNAPYVVVTLMSTAANIGFVVATFASTIYLQQVEGYSPLEASVIFLAASISCGAAGPISGWIGERFDIPRSIATASIVGSVGLLIVSLGGNLGPYLPGLALMGFGFGLGWAMASVGTQTVVPPERAGQASGVTLAIVIGVGGLAITMAATLIEGGTSLGSSIEEVLRWMAIGIAASTVLLAWAAARLMPRRPAPVSP